ncbi:hypothetical protein QW131_17565 [Roseibium salinum]|nr:hypothetical protein [Roseibium salinum]
MTLSQGSQLTGYEGVDLITKYDNVDTHSKAFARATGLFGFVDANANNETDLRSHVTGAGNGVTDAQVTAGPRAFNDAILAHPTNSGIPSGADEHLAFWISTENGGSISRSVDADVSKRSLAVGGCRSSQRILVPR